MSIHDPVANYLPQFGTHGKEEVTIKQLLTHTSGVPASIQTSQYDTVDEMWDAILEIELINTPGTTMVYSDVSMLVLGKLIEEVSSEPLDAYIHEHITKPLGMNETMFNPPEELLGQIAPTEYTDERGLVWGIVHDEKADDLGGATGHAGLFSTAYDLAIFLQMLLNGGTYDDEQILQPETVERMMRNEIIRETTSVKV
ncbi:beta-lactamase class C [Geomicrobium sp. JCM 19037]|nr:beta-lactamase class C [Geomicrobium sp. JCM 19037]